MTLWVVCGFLTGAWVVLVWRYVQLRRERNLLRVSIDSLAETFGEIIAAVMVDRVE